MNPTKKSDASPNSLIDFLKPRKIKNKLTNRKHSIQPNPH